MKIAVSSTPSFARELTGLSVSGQRMRAPNGSAKPGGRQSLRREMV